MSDKAGVRLNQWNAYSAFNKSIVYDMYTKALWAIPVALSCSYSARPSKGVEALGGWITRAV